MQIMFSKIVLKVLMAVCKNAIKTLLKSWILSTIGKKIMKFKNEKLNGLKMTWMIWIILMFVACLTTWILKPTEPPKIETETVYSIEVVERTVWKLPPINCKDNNYPTKIGGMFPNELAVLYAKVYFDYDRCINAYIEAREFVNNHNRYSR